MSPPRLLFVHAHPDDESLWTGGTIARHIDRGGEVDLVTCTWDEGTHRHGELLAATKALGMGREPIMLGYADAQVPESAPDSERFCDVAFNDQVRELVTIIRRLRPEAVVTYDPIGVYGHPDHVHAHRLAVAAAEASGVGGLHRSAGLPWQVGSVYQVTIPGWMLDIIWPEVFGDTPRDAMPGTPDSDIAVTNDVSAWRDRKFAAIEAHRSEIDRSRTLSLLMNMPTDRRNLLLDSECYIRRDLTAGGADLVW
ncbi:PIG-L family deacetylase [Gordonia soli]|uniref:N-acetyl-1-D-myo-Inosityl-2-amino-2-deoxy-alpha-D-glucopyranoside deacetylase MshB n=1 Tax=Gordonia soli NBRC 108243 TaxID=1223545 RepID=M0QLW4_9ACTN|nr:PIG-L family deacetylase [Gordonia soli]GAC69665.1 N-acetyl-1-D-myo-Inosityl-2-amino-2-deoxy-alpha-D-glucopyranoside deacetylase MshB [Gordonia soli NBRC 108243]